MTVKNKEKIRRFRNDILKGPKIATEEETKAMEETVKKVRNELKFRKNK